MLFFKNILIVFIMIIGTAQAEDDWEHFDCELEKLTHLLDGGVYEDKNNTLLIDDNHEVLESAHDYGIRYCYGIQQPDSRGDDVSSEQFVVIDGFKEILP